jgi:hypothetical protein
MDERYRQLYEAIYDSAVRGEGPFVRFRRYFIFPPEGGPERLGEPERFGGPLIERAVQNSEEERGDGARLRQDAKALLAVNFEELVLLPLLVGGLVREDEIADVVQRDIATLVSRAEPERVSRTGLEISGRLEISGHAVIDSLSRNWGDLGLSRINLWEHSDE